jgi:hypothetical protein
MLNVRDELLGHGLHVGRAVYEKCPYGSGIYPLGEHLVVKAELVETAGHHERMKTERLNMSWLAHHDVGPKVADTGSFLVDMGNKTIVYMIMEKYMVDLGTLSVLNKQMPSTPLDYTAGWLLNKLFKQTAYVARMLLTDLKPQNIVANLDLVVSPLSSGNVRVASVALIDFGPEYCVSLEHDFPAHTAYLSMLLLYSSISTALGCSDCAEIVSPFIKRCSREEIRETVVWMDTQRVVQRAIRQYTSVKTASDLYKDIVL